MQYAEKAMRIPVQADSGVIALERPPGTDSIDERATNAGDQFGIEKRMT